MTDYREYLTELNKHGYNKKDNISDFWFLNKNKIAPNDDQFSLIIRWESDIGKECSKWIRQFIADRQEENIKIGNRLYKQGILEITFAKIDFNTFTFNYQNQEYNLQSFSALFLTSQVIGSSDLRGINLSEIRINDSILKNGDLSQSNFSNSNLQQLLLENINFVNANFSNARLVLIRLDMKSTLGNANFKNTFLNAITLSDKILGDGIEINKISYISLLKRSLINEKHTERRDHTEFLFVTTKDLTSYDLIGLKKYVEWYMTISKKTRFKEKLETKSFNYITNCHF